MRKASTLMFAAASFTRAETAGGWRIRRDSSALFDATALTINTDRFLDALEHVLVAFSDGLKTAAWDSREWKKVHDKMNAIVRYCGAAG